MCNMNLGHRRVIIMLEGTCVQYKGDYFIYLGKNASDKARLLRSDGRLYSGTPSIEKLNPVKEFKFKLYNGHKYIKTKVGIISLTTGRIIVLKNITALFD